MSKYNYRHAYERWYDNNFKRNARPASVVALGTADYPSSNNPYKAFMFKHQGNVYVAVGCRRFTIPEAEAWWTATHYAYADLPRHMREPGSYAANRDARAKYIMDRVLPKARREAAKRGWRV